MNKRIMRNVTVGLVLVVAVVTAVQLSGLGDYLRSNVMLKCSGEGTCGMKYYKNYVKEK